MYSMPAQPSATFAPPLAHAPPFHFPLPASQAPSFAGGAHGPAWSLASASVHAPDYHYLPPHMPVALSQSGSGPLGAVPPKRVTRSAVVAALTHAKRANAPRVGKILPHTKRGGLSDQLTKRIVARAAAAATRTQQEAALAQNPAATLTATDAQRNHTVPAEAALTLYSSAVATLTSSSDSHERQRAREAAMGIAHSLTGGDQDALQQVHDELQAVTHGTSVETANRLAHLTADHAHNFGIGDARRNMAMSNRVDLTTSPGRTRATSHDLQIVLGVLPHARTLLSTPVARDLLTVPLSPGGQHIVSSKTNMPPLSLGPPMIPLGQPVKKTKAVKQAETAKKKMAKKA